MSLHPLAADLAAEHRRDLLQQAADRRLAKSARVTRHHMRATGIMVRVRAVRPEDAPLLDAVFAGLSPVSRLARFLGPKHELTTAELRYFADVDHHNHEALVAITRGRGEPIGVARFIRDLHDSTSAEVAVEVVDEWQNLGVGRMLGERLAARARDEKITQFTALMSADNLRSQRLLAKLGPVTVVARNGATVSWSVALAFAAPVPAQRFHTPLLPPVAPDDRGLPGIRDAQGDGGSVAVRAIPIGSE